MEVQQHGPENVDDGAEKILKKVCYSVEYVVHFTGSIPPFDQGLQRSIRHAPMRPPFKTPCFCTASSVYCEQLGQYLQEGGSMGETSRWYALMAPAKILLGPT